MRLPGGVGKATAWARKAARNEAVAHWRGRPIEDRAVFYQSSGGHTMDCGPEALFRALLAAGDLAHYRHVWALRDLEAYAAGVAEFAGDERVTFVEYGSAAYDRARATARTLVTNGVFGTDFIKRDGQTYVNTGRGHPLVRVGYDVPGGGAAAAGRVRDLLSADYLLSPNEFVTTAVYERALRLRGIFRGRIVQEGDPRGDRGRLGPAERGAALAALRAAGVDPGPGRLLLYAPDRLPGPRPSADELAARVAELQAALAPAWTVLLAPPPGVQVTAVQGRLASSPAGLRGAVLPHHVPVDLAVGVADAFVTDHSGRCHDALAASRPVVFHLPGPPPDAGWYADPADWPGPVTRTPAELAAALASVSPPDAAAVREFAPKADGRVAERVVDVVFRGRTDGYDVRDVSTDGRRSVLIYLGGMRSNGITSSGLNLLAGLDHGLLDVTALYSEPADAEGRRNAAAIHPAVRVLPRVGGLVEPKPAYLARRRLLADPEPRERVPDVVAATLRDEWRRCLGDARFDHVVDFTGYSPFFSYLLAQAPDPGPHGPATTAIWLHNDMKADRAREVDGVRHLEEPLGAVAASYRHFDRLVSVSAALRDVNAANLGPVTARAVFTYAHNTIDAERIRRLAPEPPAVLLPAGGTTFVTVGRLSTEKNHDRLVRAFARVRATEPGARLVVIGDGPLRDHLRGLVAGLGVTDSVVLTGQLANPYAVMAACDCFVLSSDHEGQPMVILEARVLGLPVVATDFSSVRGSVTAEDGLVVPRSVDGVVTGLQAMLDGKVPNPPFDAEAYNARAVEEFYGAIGLAAAGPAGAGDDG